MKTILKTQFIFSHQWHFQLAVSTVLVFLATGYLAWGDLLSYEGFDYPEGSSIVGQNGGMGVGVDGTGFSQPWQLNSSGGVFTNQAGSLSYTDANGNRLMTSGGSLFLQGSLTDASNSQAAQPNRLLGYVRGTNGADAVSTWVSFLAVRQGPTTNLAELPNNPYPRSANLSLYNSAPSNQEKLALGNTALTVSNVVSLLPVGNLANDKPSNVSFSQTNLIVVRIDHVEGGTFDNAYLFVNPLLSAEPAIEQAAAESLGEFDFTFNRVRPFAGGNRSTSAGSPYSELVLDEIRIGEKFADVVPYLPSLHITRSGTDITLTWDGNFNLLSAPEVSGTYTDTGATSPFHVDASGERQFFRLASSQSKPASK